MANQLPAKSRPILPYAYTVVDQFGQKLFKQSANRATENMAFTQYVDLDGNTWVRLAGTGLVGGTVDGAPTPDQVRPFAVDGFGSLSLALPSNEWKTAPQNSTSIAYENSRLAKTTAGVCFGVAGYNSKASAQFIQLFDANALPADASVPVLFITVSAASNFSIDFGRWGRGFHTGSVVCHS